MLTVVTDDRARELDVRQAAMDWLDQQPGEHIDYAWAAKFEYGGQRMALMTQQGIRKPANLSAALTIRTAYTPPGGDRPYEDGIGPDGFQRYKYRGTDPNHHDNVALRRAKELNLPVIWFVGVAPGVYEPIYPVWIVGDDPHALEFTLAVDASQRLISPAAVTDVDTRAYVERVTKQRLHQRVFRSQVLLAYEGKCAICRLKHVELLDAAHIIADGQPHGEPVVPNGLSLCKIHHAAFDSKLVGITRVECGSGRYNDHLRTRRARINAEGADHLAMTGPFDAS